MTVKTLRKNLPKNWTVKRQGDQVAVREPGGVEFNVDRRAGWAEPDLAAYLASRLPAQKVIPS